MKRSKGFQSDELKAYLKGYAEGREEAAKKAEENMREVWEAVDRAISFAKDMEPADGEGNHFTWQFLMEELSAMKAHRPTPHRSNPYADIARFSQN